MSFEVSYLILQFRVFLLIPPLFYEISAPPSTLFARARKQRLISFVSAQKAEALPVREVIVPAPSSDAHSVFAG